MSMQDLSWDSSHTSPYGRARSFLRPIETQVRPSGSFRYRCPITGSFVLVTDEPTLECLARPNAQLRCADCGELHAVGREIG